MVVVPYAPWFHEGAWYADVALPTLVRSSYQPFVQLAIGRFQPDSLTGDNLDLRISQVVRTDVVQLLPDRQLTIVRTDGQIEVAVDGIESNGPRRNRVELVLEQPEGPDGTQPDTNGITAFTPYPAPRPGGRYRPRRLNWALLHRA